MQLRTFALALALLLAVCGMTRSAERYVATTGSNAGGNTGTSIDSPLATITQAITLSSPGDTIWLRGGTYNLNSTISISGSKDGTALNPYKLFAYPGEAPLLDFRTEPYNASNNGMKGISLNGDYWHIKGLTVQYAADNGIAIGGSNNIVEQVVARQNQDSGFQISGSSAPSNNLLLNCDSYGNFDYGTIGENADGFAVKFRDLGPGNIVRGARAYENADDGFDFWQAENGIAVENSWSFHNGIASSFNDPAGYQGDSNGLKLGKDSGTHVLKNLLVWGNDGNGVDVNGNATESGGTVTPAVIPHGVTVLNVTSVGNGNRNFRFDEDPSTVPPSAHILRNNISFDGTNTFFAGNTTSNNTFAGPNGSPAGLGVTAADFVSTVDPVATSGNYHPAGTGGDRSGTTAPVHATGPALAPRLADGSLPSIDFMRLASTSHLINAGVDVGLPYNGSAPDLGAYEYLPPIVYDPADFNHDGFVRIDDLMILREGYGMESGATYAQGDADLDGDVDGADFLVWQRNLNAPVASAAGAPVPEPGAAALIADAALALRRQRQRVS
jgi:hypothetical protein